MAGVMFLRRAKIRRPACGAQMLELNSWAQINLRAEGGGWVRLEWYFSVASLTFDWSSVLGCPDALAAAAIAGNAEYLALRYAGVTLPGGRYSEFSTPRMWGGGLYRTGAQLRVRGLGSNPDYRDSRRTPKGAVRAAGMMRIV